MPEKYIDRISRISEDIKRKMPERYEQIDKQTDRQSSVSKNITRTTEKKVFWPRSPLQFVQTGCLPSWSLYSFPSTREEPTTGCGNLHVTQSYYCRLAKNTGPSGLASPS